MCLGTGSRVATPYQAKIAQPLHPLLFHPYGSVKQVPRIARRPRHAAPINKYGNPTSGLPDEPASSFLTVAGTPAAI